MHQRGALCARFPRAIRARRVIDRHRLSPLRSQRAGRAGVHAARDVRAHQESSDRARALRAASLVAQGVITPSRPSDGSSRRPSASARRAQDGQASTASHADRQARHDRRRCDEPTETRVAARKARSRGATSSLPCPGRLCRSTRKLVTAVRAPQGEQFETEGDVDWGLAECARRSPRCSTGGIPIRLTGQDTERGTFSHRHAGVARSARRHAIRAAAASLADRTRVVRDLQQPALGVRLRRLRVRLQRRAAERRSCSGKRSSAISSTARRSSSISSSRRVRRSGIKRRA